MSDLRRACGQEIGPCTYAHQHPDERAQEDTSFAREGINARRPGLYVPVYKTLHVEAEHRSRGASHAYGNILVQRSENETESKWKTPGFA